MRFYIITAISALALGACQKIDDDVAKHSPAMETNIASVLNELTKDPQFVWLATLQKLYPGEYETVRATMQNSADRGADLRNTKLALMEALKPIMARHRDAAKAAPDFEIVSYLRHTTAVTEALAVQDPKACTDVFQGNLDPATELPDSTWKLMSEGTAKLLQIARAGETSPVQRSDLKLTPSDYQAWREAMESVGADANTFKIITDPARKAAATPTEICRVRLQMMQGALKLPDPLAAKIVVTTLG